MIDQRFLDDLAKDLVIPEPETQPEMQLASANTGVMTDGGAFVGTRLNMPKGLTTPQQQARQSVEIADTLAGTGKGMIQGFAGLPGDLESIGRMALQYLGYDVSDETKLPTSEDIGKRLENLLGPVIPQGQTTSVPTAERERMAKGGETMGEIIAPGGQAKLAGKVIKATKNLPVGMSIQSLDGPDFLIKQAPKIETKAFKDWFGNSKVVDEKGKPKVMYHGTSANVEQFDYNFAYSGEGGSHSGSGFYFTTNPESAGMYSQKKGLEGANITPVYLSLKNPLKIDFAKGEISGADLTLTREQVKKIIMSAPGIRSKSDSPLMNFGDVNYDGFDKVLNDAINAYADGNNLAALRNDFFGDDHQKWLRSLSKATGFDSAYSVTPNGDIHYIAWFPEQIKSAIGNTGAFDPKNPSIVKGVGIGGTGAAMSQEENK